MVLKASQLSPSARRAREISKRNRPIKPQIVKRSPQPLPDLEEVSGAPVVLSSFEIDDLDALSPESREKLMREAKSELLFRMSGAKEPVKLSHTFEEAAAGLGIHSSQDQEQLLRVVFDYAMDHYRTPKANRPLSHLRHSVLRVLIEEDHTSPFEIQVHDPETWGRRNSGSLTSRVSEWGNPDRTNDPVFIHSHENQKDSYINGVAFTYYSLSKEFKEQLIVNAVNWDAERGDDAVLSTDIHTRIASLG